MTKQLEKSFRQLVSRTAFIRKGDLFKITGVMKEEKEYKAKKK